MTNERTTVSENEPPVILLPTERDWEETLAATPGLLIVDFWAPWCGPCRAIAPVLEDVVRASGGSVTLAKVNVDEQRGLAARYGVHSIPTLLFVKDGRVVDQLVGAVPRADLQAKVDALR
jgi:thioredoxin 1